MGTKVIRRTIVLATAETTTEAIMAGKAKEEEGGMVLAESLSSNLYNETIDL